MFKKFLSFWKKPAVKTTIVGAVGAAATAAAQGAFGPKGVVIAGAISAVYGLFVRSPRDEKPIEADKAGQ